MSRSDDVWYASSEWMDSRVAPGVRYEVVRVSLVRRLEIARRVRELLSELEYRSAGSEAEDRLSAAILQSSIDRLYIAWGLLQVEGLAIDGEPATVSSLLEKGPEALCHEMAEALRRQCRLSEDERKN